MNLEFSPDSEMRKMPEKLVLEFFEHVLSDEQPLFVSDETTVLDISLAAPDELRERCSAYYRTPVSADDLREPIWKLIRRLSEIRDSEPSR
jgi:hypothetical protein